MAGFILDIDGVFLHTKTLIEKSDIAARMVKEAGVPHFYVTNNSTHPAVISEYLSAALKVAVPEQDIITPESPLYHLARNKLSTKRVLFIGDKHSDEQLHSYAESFGLKNVITINELADLFPHNDITERGKVSSLTDKNVPAEVGNFGEPIEAIVVTSTPTNWERHLQLVIDVILGEGHPNRRVASYPKLTAPQIPIYTASCDMVWKHHPVNMPRFGNYVFLYALECVYEKITGTQLEYAGVYGKPSPHTYRFALDMMKSRYPDAKLKTVYCVGDNPTSDISGANGMKEQLRADDPEFKSVLVKTGLYRGGELDTASAKLGHRDYAHFSNQPDIVVEDVHEIVTKVLNK